jgi:8-amino-3,8-dideoxy-alpha-D-manno-octulosonate transaminase
VNESLGNNGQGAINFSENTWHFYPKWEHLLEGKTLTRSGYPFVEPSGKRRIIYDPSFLPQSTALLERTLVYPVSIKMTGQKLADMCRALKNAQGV